MIDNAVQVVNWVDLELLFQEFSVWTKRWYVEVSQWEIDQVLKFSPLVAIKTESFELDDQDWRWDKDFHALKMYLWAFALVTGHFIFELLCLVELGQAIFKSWIVGLVVHFIVSLFSGCMLHNFTGNGVVVVSQLLRVPLYGNEALFDEILLENWCICGKD